MTQTILSSDTLDAGRTKINANVDELLASIDLVNTGHIGQGGGAHPLATITTAGFLSPTDKTKLNGLDAALYEKLASKGVANGYVPLDANALIPSAYLSPVAISKINVVASQAAMLALTAEEGDIAVRTDQGRTYALSATPASTLANWQELLTPTDAVLSVNGQTGVVNLTAANVGALATAARAAINGVADLDASGLLPLARLSGLTNAQIAANAAIAESKLALASDAAAGTASRRTLGTGALQAAPGNDARFTPDKVLLPDVWADQVLTLTTSYQTLSPVIQIPVLGSPPAGRRWIMELIGNVMTAGTTGANSSIAIAHYWDSTAVSAVTDASVVGGGAHLNLSANDQVKQVAAVLDAPDPTVTHTLRFATKVTTVNASSATTFKAAASNLKAVARLVAA